MDSKGKRGGRRREEGGRKTRKAGEEKRGENPYFFSNVAAPQNYSCKMGRCKSARAVAASSPANM